MTSLGKLGDLSDTEWADLCDRVDRFHDAWAPDGGQGLEAFLPPPGARHRPYVLVELIKTDMGRRAEAGLAFRVETYLGRFAADLPGAVPVSLLEEEYKLRHKHADKPNLEEYRYRFPTQFEALARLLSRGPSVRPPQPPRRSGTIGFEHDPSQHTPSDGARATQSPDDPPAADPPKPGPRRTVRETRSADPAPQPRPPRGNPMAGSGSDLPHDLCPPDDSRGYRRIRRIARGEFGEVYEAESPPPSRTRVAIKCIFRPVDHPASQSELEALDSFRSLHHAYLTQVHNAWVRDDRLFIVMDLADETLADRIEYHQKRGLPGVPPEELIPFTGEAAEALDYLHSNKVTHRDVKPKNLLRLGGHAKVADIGLAKEHAGFDATHVPYEVGTPAYMAPEVQGGKVDFRSDQYSLAATYVHARLGRAPFTSPDLNHLKKQHRTATPDLAGLLPDERAVVLRALAKNAKDRYPSCVAFAKALQAAVFPPPATPHHRRFWEFVVLALVVALASALAVAVVPKIFPPPPPPVQGGGGGVGGGVGGGDVAKAEPWCPRESGWQPDPSHGTKTVGGREYYERLIRPVKGLDDDGDEILVAILVYPTKGRTGHPKPFYMLENKITNRVFKAVWERAAERPGSHISTFSRDDAVTRAGLLPGGTKLPLWGGLYAGGWRYGAIDKMGKRLGIDGSAGRPVVAVTVPEAFLVAEELGGVLPTYAQWLKAIGAMEEDGKPGPAGDAVQGTNDEKRAILAARNLAIGLLDGPREVRSRTRDEGFRGIHQLVSNSPEWLRNLRDHRPIEHLGQEPPFNTFAALAGQDIKIPQVLTFKDLKGVNQPLAVYDWNDTEQYAGFRIVLEPQ